MTEQEALQQARQILEAGDDLSKELIDDFYSLEPFIADFKFGDLCEALMAICPPELIPYM